MTANQSGLLGVALLPVAAAVVLHLARSGDPASGSTERADARERQLEQSLPPA
jgi:hypothetical protein